MATPQKPKSPAVTGPAGSRTIAQVVQGLNRWREEYNPLRGLTLQRAVALAEMYYRGEMADLQWAYFFIEGTDPDLFALVEMRVGRIVEMEYTFTPEKGADKTLAERQAKYLTEKFALIDNVQEAIEHLAMAAFRGYAHAEKWYEGGELVHFEIVDQWNVVRDGLRGRWKYNPEAKSTGFRGLPDANILPPEQFLYREVRRTINRIALFKFVRANLSEKDWDAFVEIYGVPNGVVVGPPNVPTEKEAEYQSAAEDIAEGGSGYLPHGSDWKPNTAARGVQPFRDRLDHLSEKLVLVGTGGKLTMLNGPSGLGGGQSDVHQAVFDQIASAEARRISECFNRQVVSPMLEKDFPGEKQVVYFSLLANAETDTGAAADEVVKLATAGYQVDPAEVSERTGWTVTLKPAPAAPPTTGFPPAAARIANRATPESQMRLELFRAQARRNLTAAQRQALRPLLDRLSQILEMEDEVSQDAALLKLQNDMPAMLRSAVKDPDLIAAWESIFAAALVSGAAEARAATTTPASNP